MTKYLDTLSRAERDALRRELESMYNEIVTEEAEAWRDAKIKPTCANKMRYAEAVDKVGTIQAIFDKLGIEFEFGRKIKNEH